MHRIWVIIHHSPYIYILVNNYQSTLRNIPEKQRFTIKIFFLHCLTNMSILINFEYRCLYIWDISGPSYLLLLEKLFLFYARQCEKNLQSLLHSQ